MPKKHKTEAQIAKMQERSNKRMEEQGRVKLSTSERLQALGMASHKSSSRGYVPPINGQEKAERQSLRSEQKKERHDLIKQQVESRKK